MNKIVECTQCGQQYRRTTVTDADPVCRACLSMRSGYGPIGRANAVQVMADFAADIRAMRTQRHSVKQMRRTA